MKSQYILHERLWWWPPWGVTDWWRPRMWLGGDEWCNIPLCINIPPFGAFIIYGQLRPLRNFPCRECWYYISKHPEDVAAYLPGGYLYRGGPIPYIEQWHIDNALAKIDDSLRRLAGYENDPDMLNREKCKSKILALDFARSVIAGIATQVPPTPPRLQDELLKATRDARKNVGDLIVRAGEWLECLGDDW
jgi:hypothetical protein